MNISPSQKKKKKKKKHSIWGAAPLLDGGLLELGCHGGLVVM